MEFKCREKKLLGKKEVVLILQSSSTCTLQITSLQVLFSSNLTKTLIISEILELYWVGIDVLATEHVLILQHPCILSHKNRGKRRVATITGLPWIAAITMDCSWQPLSLVFSILPPHQKHISWEASMVSQTSSCGGLMLGQKGLKTYKKH